MLARGELIHFSADDLEPHPGWWEAAIEVTDRGRLPCPLVLRPGGAVESCGAWGQLMPDGTETDIARVPFLKREWWEMGGWILDGAHYWTDNWIAVRGRELGIPTVTASGYCFTHHWAMEGRLDDRMASDRVLFDARAAR
jgi:hypothetical protein